MLVLATYLSPTHSFGRSKLGVTSKSGISKCHFVVTHLELLTKFIAGHICIKEKIEKFRSLNPHQEEISDFSETIQRYFQSFQTCQESKLSFFKDNYEGLNLTGDNDLKDRVK